MLDRLVGYELSPILWRKVQGGLSAGRVQSVTLRLVVEREREVENFVPKETFKLQGDFTTVEGKAFKAELTTTFSSEQEASSFLEQNIDATFHVSSIEKKPATKSPAAPFTTSTLQQEASRKLGFSVSRTMQNAQRLYEAGLITYMRTDSVNLSKQALSQAASVIESNYGKEYVRINQYKTSKKGAQEAHEAIRPTDLNLMEANVEYDQQRLYDLIWKRTLASQMSLAKLERTVAKIGTDKRPHAFVARGEVVVFDGFLKLYFEGVDDPSDQDQSLLPAMKKGEVAHAKQIIGIQRFSRPPYRYSEASLVKKLEELGCFAIVLEKIPSLLAKQVAESVRIPIIGIGAGSDVDGQVLVVHDLIGLTNAFNPRFLRRYMNLCEDMKTAIENYVSDVKSVDFPNQNEQY